VNVEDVYSMLINIMSTIESNKVQIMSKLDSLERRQKVIEDDIRMVVSAIAVNPTLRNNVMKEVNTSEFTKTVMYKGVSSLYPRCC
jgi:transcriptional regulator NrdR family protein